MKLFRQSSPNARPVAPAGRGLLLGMLLAALVLAVMLANFWAYRSSGMPGLGLRYVFLPLLVLAWLFWAATRYVQHLYYLHSAGLALQYLAAALFGLNPPVMVLREKLESESAPEAPEALEDEEIIVEENLVSAIGGPGVVVAPQGVAALLENWNGSVRVVGAGRHYISNLETVKEIIGLEERSAQIDKIVATTRDGIQVVVKDIRYRFRLARDIEPEDGAGRTPFTPFPFSEKGLITLVYHRQMNHDGLANWNRSIEQAVDTILTDHIRASQIDQLLTPTENKDPRSQIYRQFYSPGGRNSFRQRGAELTWIDIGLFDTLDTAVAEQRVQAWQAYWRGRASEERAHGQAQRMAAKETAISETQAAKLKGILAGLEQAGMPGDTRQGLRRLTLARLAGILESIGRPSLTRKDEDDLY